MATAKPTLTRINFKKVKLAEYDKIGAYAAYVVPSKASSEHHLSLSVASIIDNAFTLDECKSLLLAAEASSPTGWDIAQVFNSSITSSNDPNLPTVP